MNRRNPDVAAEEPVQRRRTQMKPFRQLVDRCAAAEIPIQIAKHRRQRLGHTLLPGIERKQMQQPVQQNGTAHGKIIRPFPQQANRFVKAKIQLPRIADRNQIDPGQTEGFQQRFQQRAGNADRPLHGAGVDFAGHFHVAAGPDQKDSVRPRRELRAILHKPKVTDPDELDGEDFRILPETVAPLHPFIRSGEINPQRPALQRRGVVVEKVMLRIFAHIDPPQSGDGVVDDDSALLFERCCCHSRIPSGFLFYCIGN